MKTKTIEARQPNPMVEYLEKYTKLRFELEHLILCNVRVKISEHGRIVWDCSEDAKDARFRAFEVRQEFDVESFLKELFPAIDEIYECLRVLRGGIR